ncbi:MAG: hypothetical protein RSA44_03435 [Bacteroides sp.]
MKKDHKILVAIASDPRERKLLVARIATSLGLARIVSDATKIVVGSVYDIDLSEAFVVLVSDYNFRGSTITNQRLYELAAHGIAVVVGVKSIPREFEFICRAFYSSDFSR